MNTHFSETVTESELDQWEQDHDRARADYFAAKEMKPTPGPWHVEKPYGEPGTYISSPNTALVAKVWDNDETVANARLLAAAPELLAALESFLRAPSVGSNGPGSSTIVVQDFNLRAARSAILKATTQQ